MATKSRKPFTPAVPVKNPDTGADEWTATDHRGYRFTAPTAKEAERMREDYNK